MPRFALPSCPRCHGDGEIETFTAVNPQAHPATDGTTLHYADLVAIRYEPCPCTTNPLVNAIEEYEDWTKP